MFGNLFTLDYEIHGNGDGCPYELMLEPTTRILRLFNEYGAKLTIMADVGEILKFKEYAENTGEDKFYYADIIKQLRSALSTGHDVQLHIHSSYFDSIYEDGSWSQNWMEYSLADLNYDRLNEIIRICKEFLEEVLSPVDPDYKCFAFRAANWSMSPSPNIVRALINNGILIDSSVFKYGTWDKIVKFDYSDANSDLIPWTVDHQDVCKKDDQGNLVEFPIYCEKRNIWHFITENRLYRLKQASRHKHPETKLGSNGSGQFQHQKSKLEKVAELLTKRHAWKMDFNQCTGKQLIGALRRIEAKYGHLDLDLPVVLIGHSKLFNQANGRSLKTFLEYIYNDSQKYYFATFGDFTLSSFKNIS